MTKFIMPFIILFSFNSALASFSDMISFKQFEEWCNSILPDYTLAETSQEGEAEYGESVEYSASFQKSNSSGISIGLQELREYESYKMMAPRMNGQEITIGDYNATYIPMKGQREYLMAAIKIESINATLVITSMPTLSMDEFKNLVSKLNISDLSNTAKSSVQWSDEIPEDGRLNCDIIKIRKVEPSSTDGYKYEYEVTAMMNDNLISELERLMNNFEGDLSVLRINKNIDFICSDAGDIESIRNYFKPNEEVHFIYYVK